MRKFQPAEVIIYTAVYQFAPQCGANLYPKTLPMNGKRIEMLHFLNLIV